jgi:phenylalanyl-tRNA synthetase alpha chain
LPERVLLNALKDKSGTVQEISKKTGVGGLGAAVGILKKQGFVEMDKGVLSITEAGKKAPASTALEALIKKIGAGEQPDEEETKLVQEVKKRSLFKEAETRDRIVHITDLGKKLLKEDLSQEYAERITAEDLKTGAWKEKEYRHYDVSINVPNKSYGKKHFVNEAIDWIKQVWIELGFQEMEGNMVQSAFWDLDALFVPQDHPAREMQDTFYVDKKGEAIADTQAYKRVKAVHEDGGDTGSLGWRTPFDKEESEQLLLRTHTTVLSAQTLWEIGKGNKSMPGKYFAVSNVFRNEDLDWKHLFEFHQVEGIVVDPDASFAHLLGYLEVFFKKIGYEKVRVRPAHFPYTEPSVEVDGWHPVKKQWVELGGAGLFRPEVTKTLIGKEVPVLAWGLGMERSISEYFDITDIRELYNNNLKQLRTIKKWIK